MMVFSIVMVLGAGKLGGAGAFSAIGETLKGMESVAFQIIAGNTKSYTLNRAAGRVILTVGTICNVLNICIMSRVI